MKRLLCVLLLATSIASPISFACTSDECISFQNEVKKAKLIHVKTQHPNRHSIIITGESRDGGTLRASLSSNPGLVKKYVQTMPKKELKKDLSDHAYWTKYILSFAGKVLREAQFRMLSDHLAQHAFQIKQKGNVLRFERAFEGGFEFITVEQKQRSVVITLQQSAC